MTATLLDDATQARVVAAYLKRHPEFLSASAPARCSHAATQRTPLPHWPDSEPSAFQMP
jgi:hypothetical protein